MKKKYLFLLLALGKPYKSLIYRNNDENWEASVDNSREPCNFVLTQSGVMELLSDIVPWYNIKVLTAITGINKYPTITVSLIL